MSAEEEVRALRRQLESLQKAYEISEEVVRDLTARLRTAEEGKDQAEMARLRERDETEADIKESIRKNRAWLEQREEEILRRYPRVPKK